MGLGGVGIAENYPEVSKDTMLSKLDILKDSFTANFNPDIKECDFEGPEISSFKDERMEYNKLKKIENTLLDETPKAKLDILKNINNNKNKENILLLIMLIIGLCYGIFFIYNYFIF